MYIEYIEYIEYRIYIEFHVTAVTRGHFAAWSTDQIFRCDCRVILIWQTRFTGTISAKRSLRSQNFHGSFLGWCTMNGATIVKQ